MSELVMQIPGNPSLVSEVSASVADLCRGAGFSEEICFRIQVVVAEAVNNIINYATPDRPITIDCHFDEDKQEVVINLVDHGAPFSQRPQHNFPEWSAENGRGWPIIFSWMDSVSHVRQGDANHMTLTKGRA